MLIGQRLREARIKRKLSQEELGNMIGVSKVSVCGYEKGKRTPTMEVFLSIVDILDVDPNYLLGRDVSVVSENDESYAVKLSKNDLEILNSIKKDRKLYNKLLAEPSRTVSMISKILENKDPNY